MLPPFTLERPDSIDEVLSLLDEDSAPYCGGTELLMAMKFNVVRPGRLIDLKRVAELQQVRWVGEDLVVGACVRHAVLARDENVTRELSVLADVERRVGNPRVRAQGSVGGNICFAEPRSDITTLLCALDATVTLESRNGRREIALAEFLVGGYETLRRSDELLVDVTVPRARDKWGVYTKHQFSERPVVGVALVTDRHSSDWQLCVGAVGDAPYKIKASSAEIIDADAVAQGVDPIEDRSGSVEYKRQLTAVYVRRAQRMASERRT